MVVVDALFPRFCVSCGREGALLCRTCFAAWVPTPPESSDVWALGAYADPVARQLLCAWKYQYDISAWEILKKKFTPELPTIALRAGMHRLEAIVPVPLHYQRRAERGFDQAIEIAGWLSRSIGLPVRHMLSRKFRVGHQAERTVEERQSAMITSPFMLDRRQDVPRRALLVDDVWTTGATMQAAANVVRAAGGEEVRHFTLLKG